jgi:tetratricopeptide (TPR) repeat protein
MKNLHKYANNLFIKGHYELANEIYNKLINSQYKIDIIYSNRAACFLKLKNYKSALECALFSVQNNLNNSIAWGRIGYSYKGLKMFTESLNAFEIAHKLNKNNENYLKELIFLHQRFNNKINATNIFNLLLNNKIIFNKLKNMKNEIVNTNITNCLNNNNITSLISEIMNEL